jgi:Tfp pilus assembly protein PilO
MNFQSRGFIALVLVVIILAVGYFIALPQWKAYKVAKVQLGIEQTRKAQLEEAQKQINAFLAEYRQHSADALKLNNALPLGEDQIHNILKTLETLAASSGITLSSLSFEIASQTTPVNYTIQPVDINIAISGSYDAFRSWLGHVEENIRLIDINTISVRPDLASRTFGYNIKMRTYYQK